MDDQRSSKGVFISAITGIILENLADERFGAEELVQKSGITRYRLSKKLRAATGKNINQFIREIRLRKAHEMLSDDSVTIAEVAYRTGFSSPAYFNKCFHDYFGYSPGQAKLRTSEDKLVSADEKPVKKAFPLTRSAGVTAILIVGAAILLLLPVFQAKNSEKQNKTGVVVMPFENLTNLPGWDYWERAIQRDLITTLASTREIEVRMEESVNMLMEKARLTESSFSPGSLSPRLISKKLQAEYYITGSFQKFSEKLRLDAHLVETRTRIVKRSFEVNSMSGNESAMFSLIDTLRRKITSHMLMTKIIHTNPYYQHLFSTPESLEALKFYDNAFRSDNAFDKIIWLKKAIQADSTFFRAALALESAYSNAKKSDSSRIWLIRNHNNRYRMEDHDRLLASWAYAFTFEPVEEQARHLSGLTKLDNEEPVAHYLLGMTYCTMKEFDKAIPELEKSFRIFRRWGPEFLEDARNCRNFKWLGIAYHNAGYFNKEKRLYRKAERFISDYYWFDLMNANVCYHEGDTAEALINIDRAQAKMREQNLQESEVLTETGRYFKDMGNFDVAENFFRKALSSWPDDLAAVIQYSDFCFEGNRHDDPDLFDRAMKMCGDRQIYCELMAEKGMCLHHQGKLNEAIELISKAWDEAPFKVYRIKMYLEMLRKSNPEI